MKYPQLRALSMIGALAFSGAVLAGNDAKFQKMDTNQDGMVSAQEHAAGATAMFGRMDADGDGNVTAAEMDAGHRAMKHDDGMKSGDSMSKDKMAMDKPHKMSSAEKIKKMDSNADGMLSAAEHDAGAASMFSEMDTDGDGNITGAEMKAGHKARMGDKDK